jgi:uncharacterized protein
MDDLVSRIGDALLMAFGMFWSIGWGLALGFLISAVLQVFVPREKMIALLGGNGVKQIALATGLGAASSSCSYAAASITRTLLRKGAGFITSLAFMFASTNLVIELGIILYLLMGWQFMAAEWLGGIVLVAIMSLIVKATYPRRLVEEARQKASQASIQEHSSMHIEGKNFFVKLASREARIAIAQNFAMDINMLWKDLILGSLIGGFLSVFVPQGVWQALFVHGLPSAAQIPLNALIAPIIAAVSFLCSDANVPMAAVLWGSGISFGGVLSFLYADLIILPLLDVYRRYFGWKTAVYIGVVFYITMVLAGIFMDLAFTTFGLVPEPNPNIRAEVTHFAINYTFWLNLGFGGLAAYLIWLSRRAPMKVADHCCGHDGHH